MNIQKIDLTINIDPQSELEEELSQDLTLSLQEELSQLDIESIQTEFKKDIPQNAKFGDSISWGTLIVALSSPGVLTTLSEALKSWLTRNERRSIKLTVNGDTLEITNITTEDQQKLLKSWLQRQKKLTDNG